MRRTILALAVVLLSATWVHAQRVATGGLGNFGSGGPNLLGSTGGTGGQAGTGASMASGFSSPIGGFDGTFGATQMRSLAAAATMSRAMGSAGMGLGGFGGFGGSMGGFGSSRGGFGSSRFGQFNQNQNNQNKIRAVARVGFPYAGPPASATAAVVAERIVRIPTRFATEGVRVEMEGRTAILRGEIASADDARALERILTLEPGVDAVRSELTYTAAPPPPPGVPAELVPLPSDG